MGLAWSRQGDASRAAAREHTKRCRERLRLMREAVRLRRQLAASHAGYLKSLALVASTLTRFAVGEPLPVSDHTPPAVLVHRPVVVPSTPPPLLRSIEQQQQQRERQEQDGVVAAEAPVETARRDNQGGEELRTAVRHRSLAEVAAGLEEYFVKVSVAGDAVSSLLEASNAGYHGGSTSFLGALCCLSAPSVSHDRIDSMHGGRRHSSTLQQLMAWEKKLYREVKERERLQLRHDKKLTQLRDQEYSRKINVDIQKLKASWDRARAQLDTASQAVDASSTAISGLRDTHLARQVLGLCHATRDMWKAIRQHHEAQCLIAQQLRGLSSRTSMDPTTEIHHEATRALEAAMSAWCAALGHVAKHQREYVHALHGWLKLTLAPINGAQQAPSSPVAAEFAEFVDRWGKVLDRVHCAEVLKSIKNFAGSTHALYAHQSDELRVARRVRRYSRELDRKSRMLRQVESSYYDSYVPAGFSMWNRGGRHWRDHDRMQVHDARNEVARRKEEIAVCRRMLEDEMRRHAKAIDGTRAAAVTGVQGTLPAVFQAMAAFSASHANALEAVCRHGSNHQ
ncbi:protein ROLLING AND ERECT LEAF 2-like [Lolium rigidum]|uniref:protein ROLLING AND ERECT LEAF 2-like n=1 Tax=Lolium rigidum TaxID=89674 RepID=UPI001F5DFDC7|nr:protein ROLLING AND ERECT LEAF 2-like [Lolium rigidum]